MTSEEIQARIAQIDEQVAALTDIGIQVHEMSLVDWRPKQGLIDGINALRVERAKLLNELERLP